MAKCHTNSNICTKSIIKTVRKAIHKRESKFICPEREKRFISMKWWSSIKNYTLTYPLNSGSFSTVQKPLQERHRWSFVYTSGCNIKMIFLRQPGFKIQKPLQERHSWSFIHTSDCHINVISLRHPGFEFKSLHIKGTADFCIYQWLPYGYDTYQASWF